MSECGHIKCCQTPLCLKAKILLMSIGLIGGARETLGASTAACAEAPFDGYMRTSEQQNTLMLASFFVPSQLYVFIDNVRNHERTCIDNGVL
jgi:hypothetical protein